jgi:hypothetical protein
MTPLAHYLAKQLVAPRTKREHIWVEEKNRATLREALTDVHCFETTEAIDLFNELVDSLKEQPIEKTDEIYGAYSFLPAPKTWIEWRHASGNRVATLIEEGKNWHSVTLFCELLASPLGLISAKSGDYYDGIPNRNIERFLPTFISDLGGDRSAIALLATAHTMLLLINSPKIIGRRQHMPHAGLERELTKHFSAGKFPLHAWTEIKLEVAKPTEIDDGEPHEAHLTGRRALHFVRKHIRIRLGRLEYVNAHWRGDPAIGIKQSRYRVTP